MSLSRRSLLGMGLAGLAGAAFARQAHNPNRAAKLAKNVILCVSDGMNLSVLSMVNHFKRLRGQPGSYWAQLMTDPTAVHGLQATSSLSSMVTDSAAAGSAWGSGRKLWNAMINEYPDGTQLKTVGAIAKENKMRLGMVTTATITHATPAAFAVTCPKRDLESLIAERYLKLEVDVLLGGGNRFFAPDLRTDKLDLYAKFRSAGYSIARTKGELLKVSDTPILGIFDDGHLPFTIDRMHSLELQERIPTLAEMTSVALSQLLGSSEGFFLQIEGARIDHAGHANDLGAIIHDQIAFEDAVQAAVDFAKNDGETLVIVTTDHGCGGPNLNGAGPEYKETANGFALIENIRSSYGPVFQTLGSNPTTSQTQQVIEEKLGVQLTTGEADAVVSAIKGVPPLSLLSHLSSSNSALGIALANHTKVGWTSGQHNSDHVVTTALGPGAERCQGFMENTGLFNAMLAARGLSHQNPSMTYEEAASQIEKNRATAGELALDAIDYGSGEQELIY